jgi:hypothetical protein
MPSADPEQIITIPTPTPQLVVSKYAGRPRRVRAGPMAEPGGRARTMPRVPIPDLWGLHVTGVGVCSLSPWMVNSLPREARWFPARAWRRRWCLSRAALLDHLAVAHRLVRDGQLEQPVEQHPTTPGRSSVEAEHELVEVTLEVVALRTQGNPRLQPTAHASGGPYVNP